MALRRINPSKHHLPRPFSSSSNPPPPPPPSDEPDASPRFPPPPPPNQGEADQKPVSSVFHDIRERLLLSRRPARQAPAPTISVEDMKRKLESFRSVAAPNGGPNAKMFNFSFEHLRESIRKFDRQQKKPRRPTAPFLSSSVFAREKRGRAGTPQRGSEKEKADAGIMLANKYTREDLRKKLGELRPPSAGKDGEEWSTDLRFAPRSVKEDEDKKPSKSVSEMSGLANLAAGRTKRNA